MPVGRASRTCGRRGRPRRARGGGRWGLQGGRASQLQTKEGLRATPPRAFSTCGGSAARCLSSAERASTWALLGISPAGEGPGGKKGGVVKEPAGTRDLLLPRRERRGAPRRHRKRATARTREEEPEEALWEGLAALLGSRELGLRHGVGRTGASASAVGDVSRRHVGRYGLEKKMQRAPPKDARAGSPWRKARTWSSSMV